MNELRAKYIWSDTETRIGKEGRTGKKADELSRAWGLEPKEKNQAKLNLVMKLIKLSSYFSNSKAHPHWLSRSALKEN